MMGDEKEMGREQKLEKWYFQDNSRMQNNIDLLPVGSESQGPARKLFQTG